MNAMLHAPDPDLERIRRAPTLYHKIIAAAESAAPIKRLHALTESYRNAINERHREEWEEFWTGIARQSCAKKRTRIMRVLRRAAPDTDSLSELAGHPWWRRYLFSHRLFVGLCGRTPHDRRERIVWLLKRHAFLEVWCQLIMLVPGGHEPSFPPKRYRFPPLDSSPVPEKLFKQLSGVLQQALDTHPRFRQETTIEQWEYYDRGWQTVRELFQGRLKFFSIKRSDDNQSVRRFMRGPQIIRAILEIDRALQEYGWKNYLAWRDQHLARRELIRARVEYRKTHLPRVEPQAA
jgi:hypothetical protein